MKVLHLGKFYAPFHGGMETYLEVLASHLQPAVDVHVAVAAPPARPGHQTVGGVHLRRMRTYGVVAATPMCPDLFRVIREVDPDLVHVHHPHPLAMLAYLTSGTSASCVVSYHSDIVRQRTLRRLIAPVVNRTLERAAAILVASPQLLDESALLRPFRDKCHLVPYGLGAAPRGVVDATASAELRRRHGSRIVLAVGRLTHYKGFDYLIRAMRDVDGTLLIAGEGALRERLARLVADERLGARVHLLGSVADVQPYYDACDVFVLPSTTPNEAFGIVQLEAMAAGKPVVNTALKSGVTFACPSDVAALTVPPGDSAALAGAIARLLDDPELRARLGEAGRARVAREFTAEAMSARTLDVYRAVTAAARLGVRRAAAPVRTALVFAALVTAAAVACSEGERPHAEYDQQSGQLRKLTFDATADGRNDAVGYVEGTRVRRIELDLDANGAIDRWDFYRDDGTLEKVGLSQRNDGRMDAEAFYTPAGALRVMRVSTRRDGVFDRTEYYEREALVRSEDDIDRDGRPDKWDTYRPEPDVPSSVQPYAVTSTAIDETGRGTPSRRFVYGPGGRVDRVEVDPDGDGQFTVLAQ